MHPAMNSPTADRFASTSLLVASAGMLVTMGLHPSGPETLRIAADGGHNGLARGVHLLALSMQPLLLLGVVGLTRRLSAQRPLADLALISWAVATGCVVLAAMASGLVGPRMAEEVARTSGAARDVAMQLLHYTGVINRASASLFVGFGGAAVALWSWAMRAQHGEFPLALAWGGIAAGIAGIASQLAGALRLDVRGFGLVVVLLAAWLVWVAVVLRRPAPLRS
jgi:hypothetical protein